MNLRIWLIGCALSVAKYVLAFTFQLNENQNEWISSVRTGEFQWPATMSALKAFRSPVIDNAAPFRQFAENLNSVPELETPKQLWQMFYLIRDTRQFPDSTRNETFLRRVSWLYPEDGCWIRAHVAVWKLVWERYSPANLPWKIFIFGSLRLNTTESPRGYVEWWYHVALIVRSEGEWMILDPAVDAHRPLTLDHWLQRILIHQKGTWRGAAICPPGTARPIDQCSNTAWDPDGENISQRLMQAQLFPMEWKRQMELKRDPTKVLGDAPPWLF